MGRLGAIASAATEIHLETRALMNEKAPPKASPITVRHGIIAELVIDLTIALKNASTYGKDHPFALRSVEALSEKLREVFRDREELTLQFTGAFIIFEESHLDRSNQIYRYASELFSSLGIASLTFNPGTTRQENAAFVASVITARRRRVGPDETKLLLEEAGVKHVNVGFLRDMLKFEEREHVQIKGRRQAESLWDEYLARMEEIPAQPARDQAVGSSPSAASQADGKPIAGPSQTDKASKSPGSEPETEIDKDRYAKEIVEYLRTLEKSGDAIEMLGQRPLSTKIQFFVDSLNEDLRKQLLASTFVSNDLAPDTVRVFAETIGERHALESLQQLNDENREIPISLFRALSMLSFLQPSLPKAEPSSSQPKTENVHQKLLERLLAEDQRLSYVSEEYETKMQALQDFVGTRLGPEASGDGPHRVFTEFDVEDHFLKTTANLFSGAADDSNLDGAVFKAANASIGYFLDHRLGRKCQEAIDLAKQAQAAAADLQTKISTWQELGLLDRLAKEIDSSEVDTALVARDCFASIGEPAVPKMLDALAQTESLSTRRRILAAFLKMDPFPGAALMPGLEKDEPWYLQRNTLWLFRERRDPTAANAAAALWSTATVRVKAEIIDYLKAIRYPNAGNFVKKAIFGHSHWLALKVARNLSCEQSPKELEHLVRRMEALPRWQLGSKFHLELLRSLAQSGDPRVYTYLKFVRNSPRKMFSLQHQRLQREADRLMSNLGAPNE
jgi:hypothetical protein